MIIHNFRQKSFPFFIKQEVVTIVHQVMVTPNGPAIWGGCVTRRKHRAGSWYFSQKAVTVQGGYGALFAVMVQILLSAGAIAVQVLSEPRVYPWLQSWWWALAQYRGTN